MGPAGFNSDNQLVHESSKFYLRSDCFDFSNEIFKSEKKLSCSNGSSGLLPVQIG